ncbi:F-box family protein, partial [Trifolium medium]|nr:F-box family protein [Trifolium medium]
MVELEGESRRWNLHWRRALFQWEEDSVLELVESLENVSFSLEEDKWRWSLNPDGCFSVKSAFDALSRELVMGPNLNPWEAKKFKCIWDSPAPSKVIAFSWKLLYDRVPTKENLLVRGVIQQHMGGSCVWCDVAPESSSRLFLHCKMAHVVWYEIFKWLGVVIVMPSNLFHLFDCSFKKARKGF